MDTGDKGQDKSLKCDSRHQFYWQVTDFNNATTSNFKDGNWRLDIN